MPANDPSGRPPVVLLLPGSGPVDRDSNYRSMKFDITRQLALALAEAGLASLRYDKRGVGASSGGDWRAVGLWELADDAKSALTFLAARPEVDGRRIVVLGHSEGAIIATHLAAHDSRACAAVLLSGSATSGEEVLMWQARNVVPSLPAPVRGALRLLRIDPIAKVAKNHAKLKATTSDVARIGGARVNARWFREFMAHDPKSDLSAITVPVLAITGGKDLQVDPADLNVISELVPEPVTVECPPLLTHTLRQQPGPASLRAYKKELRQPVDATLTDTVVSWALQVMRSCADGTVEHATATDLPAE